METKEIVKNEYGFREKDMKFMLQLFALEPDIEKVILYGSRSTGKFKQGSDVDLALVGEKIGFTTVAHIHHVLEEASYMPMLFDVLHYDSLQNEKLKEQIDKYGKVIYQKSEK